MVKESSAALSNGSMHGDILVSVKLECDEEMKGDGYVHMKKYLYTCDTWYIILKGIKYGRKGLTH